MIPFNLKKLFIMIKRNFFSLQLRGQVYFLVLNVENAFPECFHCIVLRFLWQPCSYFGKPVGRSFTSFKFDGFVHLQCKSRKALKPSSTLSGIEVFHQTFHGLFYYLPPIFINVSINFSFCQQVKKKQTTKH